MSRGHARDRGSCLYRPDCEEENLYKKLPQPKRRSSARGSWLMGRSVATAGPARVQADTRGVVGLSKYRGHCLDGPFFPHTRGNSMENSNFKNTNDDVGVIESALDAGTVQRTRRKRPMVDKPRGSGKDSASDAEVGGKCHTSRRGRPPKTCSGLARTHKQQSRCDVDARGEVFERDLSDWACQGDTSAQTTDAESVTAVEERRDTSQYSAEELRTYAGQSAASILEVATKSKHLKGTYVRKLKDAAAALADVVNLFATRTESDEVQRLQEENRRLGEVVEKLREELNCYRKDIQGLRASLPATNEVPQIDPLPAISEGMLEKLKRSIISSMKTMIDARFAGIEERLLPVRNMRPPLASDAMRHSCERPTRVAPLPVDSEVAGTEDKTRRRPNRKKVAARAQVTRVEPASSSSKTASTLSPATSLETSNEEGGTWVTVAKRGKKKNNSSAPKRPQRPKPKLAKPPRTKAVIVTLTPEAASKGVSYAQVLQRAQQGVDLVQLGISEGLAIRQSISGARLLELSAVHSSDQADKLADRLRVVLEGVAVITRPHKHCTLKLVGLDDSVTKDNVANAVVSASGCAANAVTISEVTLGPRGTRSVVVRCPCEAGKVIVEKGRLLVGWSAAKVQVLEERPLRCFRCLALGHSRLRCPSEVSRENLCFRCGCEGHKAHTCRAEPLCMVCTDAKRPAGHIMGSAKCNPPPVKGAETQRIEVSPEAGISGHQEESVMSP